MQIQINSDKNIEMDKKAEAYYTSALVKAFTRFENTITRLEVHLSDENSNKFGTDDKRCLIEARLINRQPVVTTNTSDTLEKSFTGSINKLKSLLDSTVGKMHDH